MLPSRHINLSIPLAIAIWFFSQSAFAGLLCFLAGILSDIDHIIEYIIHFGLRTYNLKKIYSTCWNLLKPKEEGGAEKLYLIFHAIEFAILLWLGFFLARHIYLFSIALGYTGHIILDASANRVKPQTYFIILRMKYGFETIKFIKYPTKF